MPRLHCSDRVKRTVQSFRLSEPWSFQHLNKDEDCIMSWVNNQLSMSFCPFARGRGISISISLYKGRSLSEHLDSNEPNWKPSKDKQLENNVWESWLKAEFNVSNQTWPNHCSYCSLEAEWLMRWSLCAHCFLTQLLSAHGIRHRSNNLLLCRAKAVICFTEVS